MCCQLQQTGGKLSISEYILDFRWLLQVPTRHFLVLSQAPLVQLKKFYSFRVENISLFLPSQEKLSLHSANTEGLEGVKNISPLVVCS